MYLEWAGCRYQNRPHQDQFSWGSLPQVDNLVGEGYKVRLTDFGARIEVKKAHKWALRIIALRTDSHP
jgi:hypothetical protein